MTRHTYSRYAHEHPPLSDDLVAAVKASRDWKERVEGAVAANAVVVENHCAERAKTRRWAFLAGYRIPVPTTISCDIAYVFDAAELEHRRRFADFLADPAKVARAEPLDPALLCGMAMCGWWQTPTERRGHRTWQHRDNKRSARSNHGLWMASWDAASAPILAPA